MSNAAGIAEAICSYVVGSGLRPGDRLPPERSLAATLDVSRPALREAASRLVDAGVLCTRQGSGTYVADVDLDQLFTVRARLEPLAAGLAAEHATAREVSAMTRILGRLAASVHDAGAFARADLELHERIAGASRNAVLVRVLADLGQLLRLSRDQTAGDAGVRAQALEDLGRLVDAIEQRDPGRAELAMSRHLAKIRAASGDVD